jgi:RHS repeat-associated protein
VVGVTDNSGSLLDAIAYDGYGNVASESASGSTGRYTYAGRERETETGLLYYRARYYDSVTSRWTSQDPLGFEAGDSNLYRYVHDAPPSGTDPSGEELLAFGRQSANEAVDWVKSVGVTATSKDVGPVPSYNGWDPQDGHLWLILPGQGIGEASDKKAEKASGGVWRAYNALRKGTAFDQITAQSAVDHSFFTVDVPRALNMSQDNLREIYAQNVTYYYRQTNSWDIALQMAEKGYRPASNAQRYAGALAAIGIDPDGRKAIDLAMRLTTAEKLSALEILRQQRDVALAAARGVNVDAVPPVAVAPIGRPEKRPEQLSFWEFAARSATSVGKGFAQVITKGIPELGQEAWNLALDVWDAGLLLADNSRPIEPPRSKMLGGYEAALKQGKQRQFWLQFYGDVGTGGGLNVYQRWARAFETGDLKDLDEANEASGAFLWNFVPVPTRMRAPNIKVHIKPAPALEMVGGAAATRRLAFGNVLVDVVDWGGVGGWRALGWPGPIMSLMGVPGDPNQQNPGANQGEPPPANANAPAASSGPQSRPRLQRVAELEQSLSGYRRFEQVTGELAIGSDGRVMQAGEEWISGQVLPGGELNVAWAEHIGDVGQFARQIEELTGTRITSITGTASVRSGPLDPALLGDLVRSGAFDPERYARMLQNHLGGRWEVTRNARTGKFESRRVGG